MAARQCAIHQAVEPPTCPAPCNPSAPQTVLENELLRLGLQIKETEADYSVKLKECAVLRADVLEKRDEVEEARRRLAEVLERIRELEEKLDLLTQQAGAAMVSRGQELERETRQRALEASLVDAQKELAEVRDLVNAQQEFREKFLQEEQRAEELARQIDNFQLNNARVSEQIHLEMQRIKETRKKVKEIFQIRKLKFDEKLRELEPLPEILRATDARLELARDAQAISEHKMQNLVREVNCAREKIHALQQNVPRPAEPKNENANAALQQRVQQVAEANAALKNEMERLKVNLIRAEESGAQTHRRLVEKVQECAVIGGEVDRSRERAARALDQAQNRADTMRECLKKTMGELERQLADEKARLANAEEHRDELQCRLQSMVQQLGQSLLSANQRIDELHTKLASLVPPASSTGGDRRCAGCNP